MADKPERVSAIIPVFNGERYLAQAIASVQTQGPVVAQLIVVDDGSTDQSGALASLLAPDAILVRQSNLGPGAARNAGASLARGDYLAFLDADDVWMPGKLAAQVAALDADPLLDIVGGAVEPFVSPDLDPADAARLHCHAGPLTGYVFGALLIRREAFARVGPIATGLTVGEGIDWLDRARNAGLRIDMRPEVVLRRRLHATNLGVRQRQAAGDYARVLKASLDRRRQLASASSTPSLNAHAGSSSC
jgi:glycosyltransferase involved in cell wall biosynthesis